MKFSCWEVRKEAESPAATSPSELSESVSDSAFLVTMPVFFTLKVEDLLFSGSTSCEEHSIASSEIKVLLLNAVSSVTTSTWEASG
jgi:hypothetical protein